MSFGMIAPVAGKTLPDCYKQLKANVYSGVYMNEWRPDFLNPGELTPENFKAVAQEMIALSKGKPLLFTPRHPSEAGPARKTSLFLGEEGEKLRQNFAQQAVNWGFTYIDTEYSQPIRLHWTDRKLTRVISGHNWNRTPGNLISILDNMRASEPGLKVVKFASVVRTNQDVILIAKALYHTIKSEADMDGGLGHSSPLLPGMVDLQHPDNEDYIALAATTRTLIPALTDILAREFRTGHIERHNYTFVKGAVSTARGQLSPEDTLRGYNMATYMMVHGLIPTNPKEWKDEHINTFIEEAGFLDLKEE